MIDFYKVGNKITTYRKLSHMTQDDLAEKLNVTRQALSKWELGISAPSINSLLSLCAIFETSFENLLCLNDNDRKNINLDNIFENHSRSYVINQIIRGELKLNIHKILYQLSPVERMQVLKAIKEQKITCDHVNLSAVLTPAEHSFLYNQTIHIGGKYT